ncbi:L,D-transpeptidase family protein [Hymenobacter volaticus]|uniref:L,D-transpeptidase family protein n=1 Tax=Hymenobacter volaticus TaxID=2932254 RepID=A0ABY4GI12_9BACT|nr:L,D-transpeptidase family protein [Hymenobacter volaticus]UOQ69819.1 L,D-transpeptidase family protein [Hymenobacter volaticus]
MKTTLTYQFIYLLHFLIWAIKRQVAPVVLALVCLPVLLSGGVAVAESPDAQVIRLLRQQPLDTLRPATTQEAQVALFYWRNHYAPVWTRTEGPTPEAWEGLRLLQCASQFGLEPNDYQVTRLQGLLDSLAQALGHVVSLRVRTEQHFTAALLGFARHLRDGRITNLDLRPVKLTDALALDAVGHLLQAVRSGQFATQLLSAQPTSRSYIRLRWAWQRLLRTDSAAAQRMALQVALNLERLRWEPPTDSLYLVVNIPAFSLQVIRGAHVVATHRVIVGKVSMPTPELFSAITYFQAAPEWRVPQSIAINEMLPGLQRNPGYLDQHGYQLFSATGQRVNAYRVKWKQVQPETFTYKIRQSPSARNALGHIVFRFTSPHAIYLHDTPAKAVFRASNRALSHGCIRVENPLLLARFLLQRDDTSRAAGRMQELEASINRGRTKVFSLQAPVPLFVRYLTCEADGSQLRQLPDVYNRDQALAQAWQAQSKTNLPDLAAGQ